MKTHPVEELVSIRDVVRWAASEFARGKIWFGHGADNAWDEALLLVLTELGLALELESEVLEARLTRRERQRLLDLVARRVSERLPVAYLTGEAWFAGLPFHVSPAVLVPRSPIAELIELGFQPWLDREPAHILDLCTGSGCIGIACAMAFPDAEVVLADLSPEALEIARRNIERHGLGHRVREVESDLFEALRGEEFDLIVSNPPYVDAEDLASMPPEYHHEPRLGLAAGVDGLDLVRRLLAEAADHLSAEGLLVVEVGNSAAALERAYPQLPFTWVELSRGGDGVFTLTSAELVSHAAALQGALADDAVPALR